MSPPASTNCRKAYMAGRRVRATVSTMRERWLASIESSIANIPLDCVPRIASNALASSSGPRTATPCQRSPRGLAGGLDLSEHEDVARVGWIPEHSYPRQPWDCFFEQLKSL